jgi:hypothetical protein
MVIGPNAFLEAEEGLFLITVCHLQQATEVLHLTAFLTDD